MNNLINIDFVKARQEADKLEQIANELERLTGSEYASAMGQLREGWKGDAANQFLKKGGILEDNLTITVKKIREVVSNIRGTVTKVEKAQAQAQAIVKNKNY